MSERIAVLGDGLIDHLGRRKELRDIFPQGHAILQAGWRESKGCRGCGSGLAKRQLIMDASARDRFKVELLRAPASVVSRLKLLLGVDTLSVYSRQTGKLSVQRI